MRNKNIDAAKIIRSIRHVLEDKKGENVVVLDVSKLSSVTDFYVICTGNNSRHLRALAEACEDEMTLQGLKPYRRSGTPESSWLILDFLEVVVHIFSEDARRHYALETLWKDAPRLN